MLCGVELIRLIERSLTLRSFHALFYELGLRQIILQRSGPIDLAVIPFQVMVSLGRSEPMFFAELHQLEAPAKPLLCCISQLVCIKSNFAPNAANSRPAISKMHRD